MKTLKEQYHQQKFVTKFLIAEFKKGEFDAAKKQFDQIKSKSTGLANFFNDVNAEAFNEFNTWCEDYDKWIAGLAQDRITYTALDNFSDSIIPKDTFDKSQLEKIEAQLENANDLESRITKIKTNVDDALQKITKTFETIDADLQKQNGFFAKALKKLSSADGTEKKNYSNLLLNSGNKLVDQLAAFVLGNAGTLKGDGGNIDPKQFQSQLKSFSDAFGTYANGLKQFDTFISQLHDVVINGKKFVTLDTTQKADLKTADTESKPEEPGSEAEKKKERSHDENISTTAKNAEIMPPFADILTTMGATDLKNKDPKVLKAFRDFYDHVDDAITKAIADKKIAVQKKV